MRMLVSPQAEYWRPEALSEGLRVLQNHAGVHVVAGGTDWYAARVGRPVDLPMLDISAIAALQQIDMDRESIRLGAGVSWARLQASDLTEELACLAQAARDVGGWQVQHRGTLGGNLCNASPAADGVPPLLVLEAEVELHSARGTRRMPLGDFLLGPRHTALAADELLHSVVMRRQPTTRTVFRKLGSRRYLVISFVMAAVAIQWDQQSRIAALRIAVGACSPVAQRMTALEKRLIGCPAGQLVTQIERAWTDPASMSGLSPIDDVRASAAYRLAAAKVLISQACVSLLP
jgi:CO/xanthine dehydrogenase FAD-binding subunit